MEVSLPRWRDCGIVPRVSVWRVFKITLWLIGQPLEEDVQLKTEIAVVGMGAILPGAMDISEYWSNILAAKDCTINITETKWEFEEFYEPDPRARDKTYGYRAGKMNYTPFNSMEFGIPPKIMETVASDQLFALLVAKQALLDANMYGKDAKPFNREKTGVILSTSIGKTSYMLSHRMEHGKLETIMRNSHVPEKLIGRVMERIKDSNQDWNEASHPGFLANVVSWRIDHRDHLN